MAAHAHQLLLISQAAPRTRSRIALARHCRNLSNIQGSQPGKRLFLTAAKLSQPFSIDKPIQHCLFNMPSLALWRLIRWDPLFLNSSQAF